jgi:type IV pilus assembly protein PilW
MMELRMKKFPEIRSFHGFTLIEMLIAIAVSGIVLAGLVSIFTTTNRAYTRQDETATLQQNLRTAKMNLERDIRMAGCGFGTSFVYLDNPNPILPLTSNDPIPPLLNSNGSGDANSDILTISYVNYSDPCNGVLSQLTPTDIDSTAITVAPSDVSWWTTAIAGCKVANTQFLAVYTRPDDPKITTRLRSNVITITGAGGLGKLQYTGLSAGTPPINSSLNFFSTTQLITVTYRYYSADQTLERNGQALAEGIEDLQFAFGLDTNGNGVVDDTEWVNNQTLNATQRANIRIVRVSILGRSHNPINGQVLNTRPVIEDHSIDGALQDHNLRQLLQFNVALRNMMR